MNSVTLSAIVGRAVSQGVIPSASTQACVVCERRAEEYHHWSPDEAYALDVIPLCCVCHRKVTAGLIYLNVGALLHVTASYKVTIDTEGEAKFNALVSSMTVHFLDSLYMEDGTPNPLAVHVSPKKEPPGRIRVKIKSRGVKEELLRNKIIFSVTNGYMLNLERFPTRQSLPVSSSF
jgi:hypothetical protein